MLRLAHVFGILRPLAVMAMLGGASSALAQNALSLSCAVCHGPREAPSAVPSFYGLSIAQIEAALREFRAGTRDGTAMPRLTKALNDAEIQALAFEFGAPPVR